MTKYEASFLLWWKQNYATRSLFGHSDEMAHVVFSEIWTIAVEEAAALAEDISPAAAEKVRTLCT